MSVGWPGEVSVSVRGPPPRGVTPGVGGTTPLGASTGAPGQGDMQVIQADCSPGLSLVVTWYATV